MVLYWFRNDLRLNDNPGLVRALASGEDVLPVYIFDTRCWQADEWGHIKTGSYRTQFLLKSVRDLQTQLEEAGGQLVIRTGCLLYTSPSPRDRTRSRMPSSA